MSFYTRDNSCSYVSQTEFQQLITSLLQVGLIIGSLINGPLSARYGRRASFVVASVLGCAGITIQILVTSQWPVYIGRLLLGKLLSHFFGILLLTGIEGTSNGLYVNSTVLYISEIAPAHLVSLLLLRISSSVRSTLTSILARIDGFPVSTFRERRHFRRRSGF